jgi:hypothetical protein
VEEYQEMTLLFHPMLHALLLMPVLQAGTYAHPLLMLLLDSLEDHAVMLDKDSMSLNKLEEVVEFVLSEETLALLELALPTALSIKT